MRALALIVLAGCGRLGFESTDASPVTTSCRPEQCNGVDDDCNGVIDEGCPCAPFDIGVPSALFDGPGLVWTGDAYFMAVRTSSTNVDLVRIAADGTRKSTSLGDVRLDTGKDALAWTGTQVAAVYAQGNTIVLQVFDREGVAQSPVSIGLGASAKVIWDVDRLVVAILQTPSLSVVREVALDGTPLAPDVVIEGFGTRSIAATPRYRALVGRDGGMESMVAIVPRATGVPRLALFGLTNGSYDQVVANGDGALVGIKGTTMSAFRILDRDGNFATDVTPYPAGPAGDHSYVTVVDAGTNYRAMAMNYMTAKTLYSFELAPDGTPIGTFDTWVMYMTNAWGWPSAVVTATREATAFPHTDATGTLVRFVQRCR